MTRIKKDTNIENNHNRVVWDWCRKNELWFIICSFDFDAEKYILCENLL